MSGLTPPLGETSGLELPSATENDVAVRIRASINDALVVLAWSAVTALVAAVVWWRLTPLAEYTRTADNGSMGEQDLARQVAADGWFFVVAGVAGLLSGLVLVLWRRRDPVLMVVLVALGGLLSAWIMGQVGLALGPDDPAKALPDAAVGDKVPLQLEVQATGVYVSWAVGALISALGLLFFGPDRSAQDVEHR